MAATVAAKYRLVNGQFHIRPVVLQQHCYSAEQPLELIGGDVLLLVSFVLCSVVPSIACATASIQLQQQGLMHCDGLQSGQARTVVLSERRV